MTTLSSRHALVTGASRGIGRAIALALSHHGMELTLVARSDTDLVGVSEKCTEAGASAVHTISCDLTDRGAVNALTESLGGIDILINNAGIAPSAPLERTQDDQWDSTIALNVTAPFVLCRALLPGMVDQGWGRIVNIASTAGLEGYAYTAAYVASKHGLVGLTRALAAEISTRSPDCDVTSNALCPGFVDTDILAAAVQRMVKTTECSEDEARNRLGSMNPGGKILSTEDVAKAALALIEENPGTTQGAAVVLDGASQ